MQSFLLHIGVVCSFFSSACSVLAESELLFSFNSETVFWACPGAVDALLACKVWHTGLTCAGAVDPMLVCKFGYKFWTCPFVVNSLLVCKVGHTGWTCPCVLDTLLVCGIGHTGSTRPFAVDPLLGPGVASFTQMPIKTHVPSELKNEQDP